MPRLTSRLTWHLCEITRGPHSLDLKSHRCFKRNIILKTNKSDSDFQLGTPTPNTPRKKTTRFWKFPRVPHPRKSGRGRRTGVLIFLLKDFFLHNSWSCLQAVALIADCYRLSSKNLTTHCNSQFCVSFGFVFWLGSLKMPLNVSKFGLNMIMLISNLYGGVFLYSPGPVISTCMLENNVMVTPTLPRDKN